MIGVHGRPCPVLLTKLVRVVGIGSDIRSKRPRSEVRENLSIDDGVCILVTSLVVACSTPLLICRVRIWMIPAAPSFKPGPSALRPPTARQVLLAST
jgi:hypothetical protein